MNNKGSEVSPLSRDNIRSYASGIRNVLKFFQDYLPIDLVIEHALPQILPNFFLEIVPKKEMGDTHGMTYPAHRHIRLREDVYNGACDGNGRDRFTIAHEIGHLLLHQNVSFNRAEKTNLIQGKILVYKNSEWQANCFAGELLIPQDQIIRGKCRSIYEVAKKFGVSPKAAEVQCRAYKLKVSLFDGTISVN